MRRFIPHFYMLLLFVAAHLLFGFQVTTDSIPSKEAASIYSTYSENTSIVVTDSYEVITKKEKKITVLSAEGLSHAYTSIFYDKFNEILNFELEIADPLTGKTIEKARIRDMSDASIHSSSNIFDDNRHKYYEVRSGKFPIQVNIKIETKQKNNFYYRPWIPMQRYNQKLNKSVLTFTYPIELGLRYKELNLLGTREEKMVDGKMKITWTEEDLPVQTPNMKVEDDHRLLLAPVAFQVGEYEGKMEDWSGLAAWQYRLNSGRNTLPEAFKKNIQAMVADAESDYQKIEILYEYLQKNYRYVSIQLGIGGWQTMPAAEVVKYAYGDCKGLTNLMKSMLETVGIKSNYTLVLAGKDADEIEEDLPSNQFNHVILQVSMEDGKSPVWLECTSNSLPAGYLGDFTKNRFALVVNEDGGYLTKTPAYNSAPWNTVHSNNSVKIDTQGNATITTKISLQGNFAENLLEVKQYLDSREQRDFFNSNSPVSGLIIKEYGLQVDHQDSLLKAEVAYEGFIQKFVQNTAKRTILKPFLGKISLEMLTNNSLNKLDEYLIELPESLESDNENKDLIIKEEGVELSLKAVLDGRNLRVVREIKMTLDEKMTRDEKTELLKRINSSSNKTYFFIKSTTATTNE
ncbi:DUF3857 domain-containing protein [Algoriphagus sp. D3-2-R+10]|uniref:transglutaminase-like domain-containing protein n=1 Tax=Algoriphagus aurantiacus TaxID=3103948 RepID=UPI002B3C10B1|nr:DUF3857 domain-containing protein [Algoriphagus sp. D3-2-R+10]MEB2773911.1 DUF3857 domain-containing protein [Algoriphagus sp. D3-2-R+10]